MKFPICFGSECPLPDEKLRAYLLDRLILDSNYAEDKLPKSLTAAVERLHGSLSLQDSDLLWSVMCEEAWLLVRLTAELPFVRLEIDERAEEQLRRTKDSSPCERISDRDEQKYVFLQRMILKNGSFRRSKSPDLQERSRQLCEAAGERWPEWSALLEAQRLAYLRIMAELPFLRIVM